MLENIEELVETIHQERSQKLKVDKILTQLSNGDDIEQQASDKLKEYLLNPLYKDATIVTVFSRIDFDVSLSAVRTWRIKNGVKEG